MSKFYFKTLVFNTFTTLHLGQGQDKVKTGMLALASSATASLFSGVDHMLVLRAILKQVPFWICLRLALCHLCAVLKNVPFWNMFQIGTVQTWLYRGQTTICLFNSLHFEVVLHSLLKNKQTNKCSSLALLLVSLHNLYFRTLHVTCGFDMMKFGQCQSETWPTIQNGTQCQSETCFRIAHFLNGTQHVH